MKNISELPTEEQKEEQFEHADSIARIRQKKNIEKIEKEEKFKEQQELMLKQDIAERKNELKQSLKKPVRRTKKEILTDKVRDEAQKMIDEASKKDMLESEVPEKTIWTKPEAPKEELSKKRSMRGSVFHRIGVTIKALLFPAISAATMTGTPDKDAKPLEDSLFKKIPIQSKIEEDPTDSLRIKKNTPEAKKILEVTEGKKLGKITLEGRIVVPYNDTATEVSIAYFSGDENDEYKVGTIITEMAKLGYKPGSGSVLHKVIEQNPSLSKKAPWIMAYDATEDTDDTRATEKKMVISGEKGKETIEEVTPSHAVYPTHTPNGFNRFEVSKQTGYTDYGIVFTRKITPSNTATYESGLAKK